MFAHSRFEVEGWTPTRGRKCPPCLVPDKRHLIQLAETEPDLEKVTALVEAAENAMYFRLEQLADAADGGACARG
jgi:hypothetical protein